MATPDPVADKLNRLESQKTQLKKCVDAIHDYAYENGCVTSAHISTLEELNRQIRETIGIS